jgi:hypothetical protein
MICHPITTLAETTYEHMRNLVGRTFHTENLRGERVDLKLVAVTDMRPRLPEGPDSSPEVLDRDGTLEALSGLAPADFLDSTRPFGMLFLGPEEQPLYEGLYDLELPWLFLPELRLTPLGESDWRYGKGLLYEAVVD